MSEPEQPQSEPIDPKDLIEVRLEKSPQFRVIHCDGASGRPTPNRLLGMPLYAEFVNPPGRILLDRGEHGNLTERPVKTKREIIRQFEATVLLSANDAQTLGRWILRPVKRMREKG